MVVNRKLSGVSDGRFVCDLPHIIYTYTIYGIRKMKRGQEVIRLIIMGPVVVRPGVLCMHKIIVQRTRIMHEII